jgi:biotin transport system substrate-specific component
MSTLSTTPTSIRAHVIPAPALLTKTLLVTMGTLFLAGMAQIVVPIPGSPVPVTGQTLGVLLIGATYGASLSFASVALYLLIGIIGAPVFAGGAHGFSVLAGPTGGYLAGMLVAALAIGALTRRQWDTKVQSALPQMLIGQVLIFAMGLTWLKIYTAQSWSWAFEKGLYPFMVGEGLKIAIAATALPATWRLVKSLRD